jgi:hypothetical protein
VAWVPMLAGDSRSGWDECVMSDPRATHLWDRKRLASRAFAGEVEGATAPVWDAYLLYGPEATWGGGDSLDRSAQGTPSSVLGKSSRRTYSRSSEKVRSHRG